MIKYSQNHLDNSLFAFFSLPAFGPSAYDFWSWGVYARAGSGIGSSLNPTAYDECESDQGWLPDGIYGRNDGDVGSVVELWPNHGDPGDVIAGDVFFLGTKQCQRGGGPRFGLFIHSNGDENTPWGHLDGGRHFATEGCIKVSQATRARLVSMYRVAYGRENTRLTVMGPLTNWP